jgi:hypothetical protein
LRKQKPAVGSRPLWLRQAAATIFVALTCGLLASAVSINSGTCWVMSLAWRVEGKVTFVAALTPGDGP